MKPPLTRMKLLARFVLIVMPCVACIAPTLAADPWLALAGGDGAGKGKHIVFIAAEDKPNPGKKPLPIAWTKSYTGASGKTARIFTTTMGHGEAFKVEDFRRMLANACLWCLGMEARIDPKADMKISGDFAPGAVGSKGLKPGVRPADLR